MLCVTNAKPVASKLHHHCHRPFNYSISNKKQHKLILTCADRFLEWRINGNVWLELTSMLWSTEWRGPNTAAELWRRTSTSSILGRLRRPCGRLISDTRLQQQRPAEPKTCDCGNSSLLRQQHEDENLGKAVVLWVRRMQLSTAHFNRVGVLKVG